MNNIVNPVRLLRQAATKGVIKQFADKHGFVYFGHIDPREDEFALVRGITLSTNYADNHYTVGSPNGHDVLIVERHRVASAPDKTAPRRWFIMQFDLTRAGLPHVFVNIKQHSASFYAKILSTSRTMRDVTQFVTIQGSKLAQNATIWANPAQIQAIASLKIFSHEVNEIIVSKLSHFDYEINDDRVLIYTTSQVVTPQLLDEMLLAGSWLAELCEHQ